MARDTRRCGKRADFEKFGSCTVLSKRELYRDSERPFVLWALPRLICGVATGCVVERQCRHCL